MPKFTDRDTKFMNMALRLARKYRDKVYPNPAVGALVVRNGKICGKGCHKRFGGPHAEVYAIKQAGTRASGATLYVTLEPCAHFGKTPPCADMIIRSGIKKVIAACEDPNPKALGKGFRQLAAHGIKVQRNLLRSKAIKLNSGYFDRFSAEKAQVTIKAAMSLDGKICTSTGDSKWISSSGSRKLAHTLRSRHDAVIVGINTVLRDDPRLTSHGLGKNPVRVIIDPDLKVPLTGKILNNEAPSVIMTTSTVKGKLELLRSRGIIVKTFPKTRRIDFKRIIKELKKMSIYSILIEGGGETIASALETGVVNDVCFFICPRIIGGRNAKTPVEGSGVRYVSSAVKIDNMKLKKIGPDILVTGKVF